MTVKNLKEALKLCDDGAIVSIETYAGSYAITAVLPDKGANWVRIYLINDGEAEGK